MKMLRSSVISHAHHPPFPFFASDAFFGCSCSISGLVAEYIVAIDVTRVRFPADADLIQIGAVRRCHDNSSGSGRESSGN